MDVRYVASIWKIMMNPTNIHMEDISNVFFDTIIGVANMRYYNAQQLKGVIERRSKRSIVHHMMNVRLA